VLGSFYSGLTSAFLDVHPQWVFAKNAFVNLTELQGELDIKIGISGRKKTNAARAVTTTLQGLAREFSATARELRVKRAQALVRQAWDREPKAAP
jgi:hypothetical protein